MSHLVVWSKDLGECVQCACYSPDGSILVVATVNPTKMNGSWMVLDATTRQLISMHTDGQDRIECIKFSPDGSHLALASRDNNIYIYQVSEEYRKFDRIGRCSGSSCYVSSIGELVPQSFNLNLFFFVIQTGI